MIDDADKGSNAGEIAFDYRAGDSMVGGGAFRRIDSGETVAATAHNSGRPGVMITQSIDRLRTLELAVGGFECDWTILNNCVTESSTAWGGFAAIAKLDFDVRDAMEVGPIPAGQGTGLPAGHDAYPVWETTTQYLKFRVYATVDVRLS